MIYRVKNWSEHFENDRSRIRNKCSFVCVPNKQHGMGFSYIMAEPDGAAIYGIWQMIIGACSQQSLPRNGLLTSDGELTGSPWGAADLSIKLRRPTAEIQRALDFLASPKVGWLETLQTDDSQQLPPTHREVTADSPPTHLEENRNEVKGNELIQRAPDGEFVKPATRFAPPTVETCRLLAVKSGIPEDQGDQFWNYYESNGWKVGKNKMVSIAGSMGGWAARWREKQSAQRKPAVNQRNAEMGLL